MFEKKTRNKCHSIIFRTIGVLQEAILKKLLINFEQFVPPKLQNHGAIELKFGEMVHLMKFYRVTNDERYQKDL